MERPFQFFSDGLQLQGLLHRQSAKHAVVLTHPHPLYGGDMNNHVVEIIRRAYAKSGYTTLRFNFRGTGGSQGRYDDGKAEQGDVRAAVSLLKDEGVEQVDVAGYSFGAWVSALAFCAGLPAKRLTMVSPPVAFIDFTQIGELPDLHLVVTGSRDDIAPSAVIVELLPRWNPRVTLNIVEGADHFYTDCGKQLEQTLAARIEKSDGEADTVPSGGG